MRRTLAEQAEHARRARAETVAHEVERLGSLLAEAALERVATEATARRVWFEVMVRSYESEQW